ncbi:MAG: hypothetical protein OK457_06510 [Thaumarchaeota archaeon]|nr:hypothetical protein [Nitrososphaerota archaeon]
METQPGRVLDHEKFDGVVVVGDPQLCSQHVRAWKLAGVNASTSRKASVSGLGPTTCLDVCSSNFPERIRLIDKAIRSQIKVVTTEPVSDKNETTTRLLENGVTILDPMTHHPLVTTALNLLAEGNIGSPRVLKLEAFTRDNRLSPFSLYEGLTHGVSAVQLLLKGAAAKKVYAKKVKTEYSTFYVAILSFNNGATCQLVAGNSAKEGKLEFSINGPGGMIAFNESKTLETPSGMKLTDAMSSITSVEVLFRMFSDFLNHNISESPDLKKYEVVKAIEDSSRRNQEIPL